MTPEEIAAKEAVTAAAEKEEAEYSLKMNADRLKELGGDPNTVLGLRLKDELSDDTPLTIGKLKELQKEEAQKTALKMADSIEDEKDREEVKKYLNDHIKPSGDPQKDLTIAHAAVGAVRTRQ